ncbi:MAG: DMT family transporter [Gammaproteobacteria bacterium]|nr:DMT family transporter [Gammaproteobacteria bacterium]HRX70875.1 DMT family transporter [Candidatus Competibacteraceae bacterium]
MTGKNSIPPTVASSPSNARPGLDRIGLLCAVLAAIGFSFKAILVKLAYQYGVDAETLLALRMTLSLPFFIGLAWMSARQAANRLTLRDGFWLFGLGLFGYYLASYLDFLGLRFISAALERLILFVYPTLVVLLGALFLGQSLTRRTLSALALCYVGIAFAIAHDLRLTGAAQELALGSALVFGSALSYALYLLGNGMIVGRLGTVRVTAFASIVACVLAIGQFLLLRPTTAWIQPEPVYALALAMALFSTVLPVWAVSEAIRRLGAGPVALTGSLGPIVTLLLAWLLLDETLGLAQLTGAVLVISGVMVMTRR